MSTEPDDGLINDMVAQALAEFDGLVAREPDPEMRRVLLANRRRIAERVHADTVAQLAKIIAAHEARTPAGTVH